MVRAGVRACLVVVVLVSWVIQSGTSIHAAPLAEPTIVASAAIVLDATTGTVLFDKNADEPRAPASLTKLATALTAIDLAPLDTVLRVSSADLVGEASMGLHPGDELTLEAALYGLLLASGNDAAMVIARNLSALPGDTPEVAVARFVRQMNLVAQRLGLEHTTFRNPHGLDEPGHLTTAHDLARLTRAVLQRPELRRILETPAYSDGAFSVRTTNRLLGNYPGLIGGKTGITDAAGYSLIEAAQRDGHTVIVVVLGSTHEAWYDDAVKLLDYGFEKLAMFGPLDRPATGAISVTAMQVAVATATTEPRALVLQVPATDPQVERAWFWPMSAMTAVVASGVILTGLPLVMAVVVTRRQRAARRSRHGNAVRRSVRRHNVGAQPTPRSLGGARGASVTPRRPEAIRQSGIIAFDPATAVAQRAVRAGRRGDAAVAEAHFVEALRANPAFDLTRTPEFWTMSPVGVVAAARAYRRVGRVRDARTLLTVAQISFGAVPVIREELASLPRQWNEVPVAVLTVPRLPRS
ncbi:D-alanyl-D-alanine carboxypeptidase [Thermomicrobium sp. 4228-Ro]|uniref:D-alanyl-D-alanine carboxypeptidase family protein n=1 Tax=Thermomicrobium sp. 4228-Ro TaxID=2993937 RepID=UPI002248D417|nr:D-alanyl-D-alanine carboxypeptidase family protein [Thermomicrobium sp. 4228-Ro]MCX2726426.1 D-alanyl-D-alanine carboxypeptidase [Thermomicrobium sp. 4228-Ro]